MNATENTDVSLRPLFDRKRRWSREEYRKILTALPAGYCPFCDWSETQDVLREFDQWVWIVNKSAYWRYHTLIIPKRHFSSFFDSNPSEVAEYHRVGRYVTRMYQNSHLEQALLSHSRERHTTGGRLAHFHQHFAPESEGMLAPTLVPDANHWDSSVFLAETGLEH